MGQPTGPMPMNASITYWRKLLGGSNRWTATTVRDATACQPSTGSLRAASWLSMKHALPTRPAVRIPTWPQDPAAGAWQINLLLFAAAEFIVLTLVAMFTYPGGTMFDRGTHGYRFLGNPFSDLGMTHTWSGAANPISQPLFAVALGTVGLALALSSWNWATFVRRASGSTVAGAATQVFAVACGTCFAGTALSPADLHPAAHATFIQDAFLLLLCFVAAMSYGQWRNPLTRGHAKVNAAYFGCVFVYFALCLTTLQIDIGVGVATGVVGQKIIVYLSIVNLVYQARALVRVSPRLAADRLESIDLRGQPI